MDVMSILMQFMRASQTFFIQHVLLNVGLLLLVGYAFAKLAASITLPEVTGFMIAGIILGQSVFGIVPAEISRNLSLITEITLGIIALTIGGEFYWVKLKKIGSGVLLITVIQISAALFSTTLGLVLFRMELPYALLLGAIATATAPAATVAIVQGMNASGKFVDYLYGVVALDDAGAVIVFGLVFAITSAIIGPEAAHSTASVLNPETLLIILEAILEVALSIVLGAFAGLLIHILVRKKQKKSEILILSLGLLFLTIGITVIFHLSLILTNMAAGAVIINLGARNHRIFHIIEPLTPPLYALFFVLAGTAIDLSVLANPRILTLGLVYIIFRAIGKSGGTALGAALSKSPKHVTRYLGLCMLPQGGVEIGLILAIQASPIGEYLILTQPQVLSDLLNIVLISIFINGVVGPPISKRALVKQSEGE